MVADTWNTHLHKEVVEWIMLLMWSRTDETRVWSWRTPHGTRLAMGLVVWASKPPDATMTDFAAFGP